MMCMSVLIVPCRDIFSPCHLTVKDSDQTCQMYVVTEIKKLSHMQMRPHSLQLQLNSHILTKNRKTQQVKSETNKLGHGLYTVESNIVACSNKRKSQIYNKFVIIFDLLTILCLLVPISRRLEATKITHLTKNQFFAPAPLGRMYRFTAEADRNQILLKLFKYFPQA